VTQPSDAPLLRLTDVSKHFTVADGLGRSPQRGVIRAVDGVSFDIGEARTLALVGESGCGKTTTSRLVLRLEVPTSGTIAFRGEDVQRLRRSGLRTYRSQVQAVFQDPWSSLNPRMRVRDIVAEPMKTNLRLSRQGIAGRVADLLDRVGLEAAAAASFPHEFSGGQRQRIALARSLSLNPRLIVLDEPVSALDVSFRAQIMNLLKDLQAELGVSYLLIAHNLATVRYLSHTVAVMYLGQIVEMAPAEILFTRTRHPYSSALISASVTAHPGVHREKIILRDEIPSPLRPPAGCRFHPRCPLRKRLGNPARCEDEAPPLRELADGHVVACHFAEQNEPADLPGITAPTPGPAAPAVQQTVSA
jgi:oligopeptide/dipeptide ABC transporter ATP-binding protein